MTIKNQKGKKSWNGHLTLDYYRRGYRGTSHPHGCVVPPCRDSVIAVALLEPSGKGRMTQNSCFRFRVPELTFSITNSWRWWKKECWWNFWPSAWILNSALMNTKVSVFHWTVKSSCLLIFSTNGTSPKTSWSFVSWEQVRKRQVAGVPKCFIHCWVAFVEVFWPFMMMVETYWQLLSSVWTLAFLLANPRSEVMILVPWNKITQNGC